MHNTGNPIGSDSLLDLYDNSSNIDQYVNSQEDTFPDRFGVKRLTLAGLIKRSMSLRNEINDFSGALLFKPEWSDVPMNVSEGVGGEGGALNLQAEALGNRSEVNKIHSREALRRTYAEAGLSLAAGSFEVGGTLENASDVLLHEASGKAYGWAGAFPKVVAAGSGVAGFVDKSALMTGAGVIRENRFALRDFVSIKDFGAVENDTSKAALNTLAIQLALDSHRCVLVPAGTFNINRPLQPNDGQLIFGTGEIKNITVMNIGTTDYQDSLVFTNKNVGGKVNPVVTNIHDHGVRFDIGDYKAGQFYRLPLASSSSKFAVGELVMIESKVFVGEYLLPDSSFLTRISEVSEDWISFDNPHRLSIPNATIRSMSGYTIPQDVVIRDITLSASFYVGDGNFGGIGGFSGYNCEISNVKMNGGIGYSVNNMHRFTIKDCQINTEFNGIEEALLSSDNTFINNKITQRAGFVSSSFGVNGNKSSAAIMSAEGASGLIAHNNEITGNWYIPLWFKSITQPISIVDNIVNGENYCSAYLFGRNTDVKMSGNLLTNSGESGLGVLAEPDVIITSRDNVIDAKNVGFAVNRAKINTIGDTIKSNLKIRIAIDKLSESPSSFVSGDDSAEMIKPKSYTAGKTVPINSLPSGVLFSQQVSGSDVCQSGAACTVSGNFNFTSSISRTVTITLGSASTTFTVTGQNCSVKAGIITAIDDGSNGYGLGFADVTCDGVVQNKLLTTYPTPVWNGGGISIAVAGGGDVAGRFFNTEFSNNKCILLL